MRKVFISILILIPAVYAAASLDNVYCIDKDPQHVLYGSLSQDDPALIQRMTASIAEWACGPVAVTNSFRYLENKYPSVYDNQLTNGDLVNTAGNLATLMNTRAGIGTEWDDLIWYKYWYIEHRPGLAGKTVYKAQYNPAWDWSIWDDASVARPDWVKSQMPTWKFLWEELKHCEDVEILISWIDRTDPEKPQSGGHYLTLSSFCWTDADRDGMIDLEEKATIDFIDPGTGQKTYTSIWQEALDGYLKTGYNGWQPIITMAVSESIPEPVTLLLLGLGGLMTRKR